MKGINWSVRWRTVLLGTGIGIVVMVSACAGAAALMSGGAVGTERMGLFAAGILVLSGLSAGLGALLYSGGAADAALAAFGVLVVLFGLNGVFNGGQMEGVGVTILALSGGSGAAVLLRLRKGSGRKRHRKRR